MSCRRNASIALFVGASLSFASMAHARPVYFAAFTSRYPDATQIAICGTCHIDFNGGGARNPFGLAFFAAGGPSNPSAALAAIEGGADEAAEQGVWSVRAGLELRVELGGDEEGMVREFDHLDQIALR